MRAATFFLTAMLFLIGGAFAAARAETIGAFGEIFARYDAVRLALLNDSMAEVEENAGAIAGRAEALESGLDAAEAGVSEDDAEKLRALLPEIVAAAARLATSEDLDQAREAFFELSKPMGRYRKLAGTQGTMVVFCPMAKKAWIQPQGEIGNPYFGQSMAKCGEAVAD